MTFDAFQNYCLSKPSVEEHYPFRGECAWIKVQGKMFAMANCMEMKMDGQQVPPFHFINLKCDPAYAEELREQHAAIQPAWHQDKKHWNTLYIDGSLPDSLIQELIDHAYALVVASLSKKQRDSLNNS